MWFLNLGDNFETISHYVSLHDCRMHELPTEAGETETAKATGCYELVG